MARGFDNYCRKNLYTCVKKDLRYINFNQLRSFHAVAMTGNVTNAAKLLRVSQPTVTTQLKALEEYYGCELAHRLPRGVRLTPMGESLYELTVRIFSLEEEALDLFDIAKKLDSGHIAVGTVGPHFVMDLLANFVGKYPKIHVSLKSGNSDGILRNIMDHRVDVAVLGNVKDDPRLFKLPFSEHRVILVVGKRHPWFQRKSVKIEELEGEKLISREPGSQTRHVLEAALEKRGIRPDVVMEVEREAVRQAAMAGMGLGIGILSEVEIGTEKNLHMIEISNADIRTKASIVALKERSQARIVRAFLDIAIGMATS